MGLLDDANIRAAFDCSNIEASQRDYQGRVLDGAMASARLAAPDVLALSQAEVSLKPDGSSMGAATMLLVVAKLGIGVAEQKGLFSKRIEVQSYSYKNMSAVVPDEKLYTPTRGEMAIQGMVGGSVPSFRVGWNWSRGGPVKAAEAAAERDRILRTMQRAMQGDWLTPSSEAAGSPPGVTVPSPGLDTGNSGSPELAIFRRSGST